MALRSSLTGALLALVCAFPVFAAPSLLPNGVRTFVESELASAKRLPDSGGVAWIQSDVLAAHDAGQDLDVILELAVVAKARSEDDLATIEAVQRRAAASLFALGARDVKALSHEPLIRAVIPARALLRVSGLGSVVAIYANTPVEAHRLEGGAMIGAFTLQSQYIARGRGIGVAVFDSGIDPSHPELVHSVVAGIDVVYGVDPFSDIDGHGTAVSGIVHAMAPDAHLFAFKVLDDEGRGDLFTLIAGLNAAYANRSAFGGIRVINASLGGGGPVNANCDKKNPMSGIISKLEKAGILLVFSSGNDAHLNGISAFACHSKILSVGAVYDGDLGRLEFSNCTDETSAARQIACYSNSGVPLDVLAPSHNSLTTAPGGDYNPFFGGTSAAAPYVAGLIAQIRSRLPKAKPAGIRNALATTGIPIRDINGITRNLVSGPSAYRKLGGK